LFVSSRLNVSFDKFLIMDMGMQTSNVKIIKRESEVRYTGKKCLRIDLLGRSVLLDEMFLPSKGFLEIKNGVKWEKRVKVIK